MRITANNIGSANMIDLLSSSESMTDEGKIIHINASHAQNGTMIDIKSPMLTNGKVISLTAKKLTTGKILELIDNEDLTSGKLLHMKTTSSNAINPVQIELDEMTDGIGVRMDYEKLTSGTGLLIDSKDGSDLDARSDLLAAASMGSTAFQKGLGAIHSLSHPLNAQFNLHHGLSNAIFMPYVLSFNKENIEERIISICDYLNLSKSFDAFLEWVLELSLIHI